MRFQAETFIEILNGALILAKNIVNIPSVVIGQKIIRLQKDCFCIVLEGTLMLTEFIVSSTSVVIGSSIIGFRRIALLKSSMAI